MLLHELVQMRQIVALLINPNKPRNQGRKPAELQEGRGAIRAKSCLTDVPPARDGIEPAFTALVARRVGGLLVR